MASPLVNRRYYLRRRPQGLCTESDFELVREEVPEIEPGQALVRTMYLSLDPTMRIWMSDHRSYMPPSPVGAVMRGLGIGQVVKSRRDALPVGSLVAGLTGWQDYCVADDLPMPDASVDACITERVLLFLSNPGLGIAEMVRVLRPGGRIVSYEIDLAATILPGDPVVANQIVELLGEGVGDARLGRRLPVYRGPHRLAVQRPAARLSADARPSFSPPQPKPRSPPAARHQQARPIPLIVIGFSMRCGSGSAPSGANQGACAGASGHSVHFRPTRSTAIG